ncbi:DUF1552 domain-containing protein [Fimbriimonas ginsengisoli]|uniref:DUF1552 domain-containing protein n=1 Tax=Fimbriimonas ginsengisoli Gsoil 348 TaxID=661478 RepID=A0A068NTS0_FIMGI|nr:DUF1552 domain-containing protein [Fimbriimonas ginsengisoli]AIE86938.1 hypothetical protein OP10G_3570 [Fimbriimonas ginsengisoli Gsoil 348]
MSQLIARRTFLKGLGTAMAIPLLEGMLPITAMAASPKARVVRMGFVFVPNGIRMSEWTPEIEGTSYVLPSTLEPLHAVRSSVSVLTGLTQKNAFALGDGPGDHARSAAAWLTGVHPKKTAGADIKNGISADQLAAMHIGKNTLFPSIELGCERGAQAGNCDSGYSCAYSSSISWRGEATPVAKEVNPRLVFERLFGNGDSKESAESRLRRARYNHSILDFVLEDASNLRGQLGKRDQLKLDEYLTSVREIELRISKYDQATAVMVEGGVRIPSGVPKDYADHIKLMGDMMVLAFQADLTRVGTLMYANEGSNRSYAQIGVPEGHHDISHHGNEPAKLEKKRQIDRFHVEQLAYMLERMQGIKEVDGTLLDNSMIVYGGGISDGNRHNHDDLPILLAGKGGGTVHTGEHKRYANGTPMNNLFLSMLDKVGVPVETLGDSTGKLQGLF